MKSTLHIDSGTQPGWPALILALVLAAGCGRTLTWGSTTPCIFDRDCPEGLRCLNQLCVEESALDAGLLGKPFGESCDAGAECQSGRCVGGPRGSFCTIGCQGACPGAFVCKQLLAPDAGGGGLCALPQPLVCQPCTGDLDCGATGADRCLPFGAERFCGLDCTWAGCPAGYTCQDSAGARQCLPSGGSCDCGPSTRGLTKGCGLGADAGTCYGGQSCQDAGWSACNARTPRFESCNGVDDDCNALVDDALPVRPCSRSEGGRTCPGKEVCEGATGLRCDAPSPRPETCDGVDNDCNGATDELFVDWVGRYVISPSHCGGCGVNCQTLVSHALTTRCRLDVTGAPECAAVSCQAGYYPSDAGDCLQLSQRLCQPCLTAADCAGPDNACLLLDGERVCARTCATGSPYPACPGGYACASVDGGRQCLPTSGSCACRAANLNASRSCQLSTCRGYQVCGLDAGTPRWSGCDIAPYNPEICDGIDNDCDGVMDNGFKNPVTGKYDTVTSCGFCNNDCTKMWSPSLQHTNGVCDSSPALPVCRMGPCTTEVVGGVVHEWVNVNSENADGCECRRVQGNVATDLPDLAPSSTGAYLDQNCDGIDGVIANALFVRALAPAGGNGSLASPFNTLGAALTAFGPSGKSYILVAEGGYRENVLLAAGVQLFGGYSASFKQRDPRLYRSVISGQPRAGSASGAIAAVHAQGISALLPRTIVSGFVIDGQDVSTAPAANAQGVSTYAVYIRDCGAGLVVTNNDILAGRGGRGGRGSDGLQGFGRQASAALDGRAGQNGGRAAGPCPAGLWRAGGLGGVNPQCTGASAAPGGGAVCPQFNWSSTPVQGARAQYLSADGGNGLGGYDKSFNANSGTWCGQVTSSGSPTNNQSASGRDGKAGDDGVAGGGGTGPRAAARFGSIALFEWAASPWAASAGQPGSTAPPGGGGGAGGGTAHFPSGGCASYEYGSSAGGGGAGGCGGAGALPGRPGGASIVVLAVFTAPLTPAGAPQLFGNRLDRNFGGEGGAGGFGGAGGLGGAGGFGGVATSWSGSVAGQGGKGGNGGAGGGGGGGAGGPSFGILTLNLDPSGWAAQNTFTVSSTSNTGGQGGPGGSSAGTGATGTPGPGGAFADALALTRCAPGCPLGQSCDANGVCVPN
ncbi:MAG: putative metal-binding motif-containing protein [Myxococcaceae bacterium]